MTTTIEPFLNKPTYKILVKDGSGNNLGEFEKFRNLKFGKKLNNYGAASFEVPVNDPKAGDLIALREYTVWIYRTDNEGELLLWSGEQATRIGSLDNKKDNWVTVNCYDWLEQLNSRYTADEVTFTGIDAGEIAWQLIDTTQADTDGDFGITEGTIEATQDRDRTYYNQNILDAIINLSNVINGFDFEINTSRAFNVYGFQGIDQSDTLVLEYGVNVTSIQITEDFSKIVNRAIELGDSGDPMDPLRVERNNSASQTLYKLRENLDNEMTIIEIATLNEKGDSILRKYNEPLISLSMGLIRGKSPTIADFSLGDIVRLKVKEGFYNIDRVFRIFEWGITFNTDNTETLSLILGDFYTEAIS